LYHAQRQGATPPSEGLTMLTNDQGGQGGAVGLYAARGAPALRHVTYPPALAVVRVGNLHVTDTGNYRMLKYSPQP
jgi:hypothetical protein